VRLSLIVAMTHAGVIGRQGKLPWKLSADLKRFKALTMGHHLIMGSRTLLSLGKLLPGRISLVLTRRSSPYDFDFSFEGGQPTTLYDEVVEARRSGRPEPERFVPFALVHSLDEAIDLAAGDDEAFVIGGWKVFELALPRAERLYVTWVEADVAGDTWFPSWSPADWRLVSSEPFPADARNEYDTTFSVYDRT